MQPENVTLLIPERPAAFQPAAIQSHKLTFRKWGNEREIVLCVHGLTRNSHDFDFLAQTLAHRFQVICPDMPGRGASDWLASPADYNYATYIADILHLLDSSGITRVHWVGTSMGGIIAMMMAAMRPGLIKSLVLNDVGCLIPAAGLQRILGYAGIKTRFATLEDATHNLREICKPFGITEERHWQHLFTHGIHPSGDGTYMLHYDPAIITPLKTAEIKDVDLWQCWPALQAARVLLIRGQQSDILLQSTASAMQASHPDCTLYEAPRTGHAPALMKNEEIELISNWLASGA